MAIFSICHIPSKPRHSHNRLQQLGERCDKLSSMDIQKCICLPQKLCTLDLSQWYHEDCIWNYVFVGRCLNTAVMPCSHDTLPNYHQLFVNQLIYMDSNLSVSQGLMRTWSELHVGTRPVSFSALRGFRALTQLSCLIFLL